MARRVELALLRTFPVAMARESRAGERGLSLIEALVIVTVTALLALILLPLASGAAGRNFARADRAIAAAEAGAAEQAFRALLRSSVQDETTPSNGSAAAFAFVAGPDQSVACVQSGAPRPVRFAVSSGEGGGALYCEADGRQVVLLRWPQGRGRFSYSDDGAAWTGAWTDPAAAQRGLGGSAPQTHTAPLVRFELDEGGLSWTERAGWSEPVRVLAERGQ